MPAALLCSLLAHVPSVRDGPSGQPGSSQLTNSAWGSAGGGGGPTGGRATAPRPGPDSEESWQHAEDQHHSKTP